MKSALKWFSLGLVLFLWACAGGSKGEAPPVTPAFTLSLGGTQVSLAPGESAITLLQVTPQNGFTGSVTFQISGLPTAISGTLDATSSATGTNLHLAASAGAAPGTYPFTVTGTASGAANASVSGSVVVTAPTGPGFSLSVSPSDLSVVQGGTGTASLTLVPLGGFNGALTFTQSGLPADATLNLTTTSSTQGTLTFTIPSTVPPGLYPVSIQGSSPGVPTASTLLRLTVTSALSPNFALALTPTTLTIQPGKADSTSVVVTANHGFSGSVAFAVTGLPSGVTGAFNPTASASGSTLTLSVDSTVAVGSYPLAVTGSAAGAPNATAGLTLTVTGGGTDTMFHFMPSQWGRDVIFLAYQDGSAPWTSVVPTGGLYRFNMVSAKGAVAFTSRSRLHADDIYTIVSYGSVDALKHLNDNPSPHLADVSGTFSGATANQNLSVAVGAGGIDNVSNAGSSGTWAISGTVGGAKTDLLATLSGPTGLGRSILRRDLDLTATLPTMGGDLNFSGAEAFDQVSYPLASHGLTGGTLLTSSAGSHLKTPGLDVGVINGSFGIGTLPSAIGLIPADKLRAGDLLSVSLQAMFMNATTPADVVLTLMSQTYVDKPQALDLKFEAPAALPTLTVLQNAPYPRLRIASKVAAPYGSGFTGVLVQAKSQSTWARGWTLLVDASFTNTDQTFQVDIPDFTGLSGWDNAWAFQASTPALPLPVSWSTTHAGRTWGYGQPISGSTQVTTSYGGQTTLP